MDFLLFIEILYKTLEIYRNGCYNKRYEWRNGVKNRIWELDALRGLNLLWMMVIHFIYDITFLFPLVQWTAPGWYTFLVRLCSVLFILISGICVTLGKHSLRRGLTVLGGGMIITAVTVALAVTGLCDSSIIIYFGILHCLGLCMLLWPLVKKCPGWVLLLLGLALRYVGRYFDTLSLDTYWLVPLGLHPDDFASSDYFPIVQHFGIFLVGAGLGRYLYSKKTSLLPKVKQNPPIRFLSFCGRHSLLIYLLHQPVLSLIAAGLFLILS